jgi:hypothetical protein
MAEERHGRGMGAAWARNAMCELDFRGPDDEQCATRNMLGLQ